MFDHKNLGVYVLFCAVLTLFYSPQFGLFSEYYEAHIHYVSAKVNRRNKYHRSYINGKSID